MRATDLKAYKHMRENGKGRAGDIYGRPHLAGLRHRRRICKRTASTVEKSKHKAIEDGLALTR